MKPRRRSPAPDAPRETVEVRTSSYLNGFFGFFGFQGFLGSGSWVRVLRVRRAEAGGWRLEAGGWEMDTELKLRARSKSVKPFRDRPPPSVLRVPRPAPRVSVSASRGRRRGA